MSDSGLSEDVAAMNAILRRQRGRHPLLFVVVGVVVLGHAILNAFGIDLYGCDPEPSLDVMLIVIGCAALGYAIWMWVARRRDAAREKAIREAWSARHVVFGYSVPDGIIAMPVGVDDRQA